MHIVQVSFGRLPLPCQTGFGCDNTVYYLSRALGKLAGCDVGLVDLKSKCRNGNGINFTYHEVLNPHITDSGFFTHTFKMLLFSFCALIKVLSIHSKKKIDIVHMHNQFPATAILIAKSLLGLRFKTVYKMHNAGIMIPGIVNYITKRPLESFVVSNVDHIIAPTPTVKKCLVEKFKIPETKISQIYYGLEVDIILEYVNTHPKPASGKKRVIYVGGICKRKNQLTVIKAVKKVAEKFPDIECLLVGPFSEPAYKAKLAGFIKQNALEKNVILYGPAERETMYGLVYDSTLAAISSVFETQGLMLLEAMALGIPAVVSNIGPFEDVINQEPGCAISTGPFDDEGFAAAIISFLSNDRLYSEAAKKSQKLASRFTWDSIALQTYSLYRSMQP